ncbi:hypothetical protein ONV75_15710 [Clostridium sp. LQ25]|uniref:hypothetical protein n=1 Tax=Clostridium sp. LQ25 TaxID=2992805 RepID=UPI002256317D|nr:hypothetical protein [Clostridium sp. LQ25]UZT06029.1 hypothetical protein ONV75_15710 [Clostridium sp. LQ25]
MKSFNFFKLHKIDYLINNFIKSYKNYIYIVVFIIISIFIRNVFWKIESTDFKVFLSPWIQYLKNNGGIFGVRSIDSNYNVSYLYLLGIGVYLPISYLSLIKMISVIFDIFLASGVFLVIGEIFKHSTRKKIISLIGVSLVLLSPNVILNSSAWAQCDSIYVSFIIYSMYYYLKHKYTKSFIFLGIAFAFKLQAIFIVPLYIILYLKENKFTILNFLLIPIISIVLYIPALIVGRPISKLWGIYFGQIGETQDLVYNFPSIYNLIPNDPETFRTAGVLFTICALGIIAIYALHTDKEYDSKDMIELGLIIVVVITYFMPGMHDRYMYIADILSIIYCISSKKKIFIALGINLMSFNSYIAYLFGYPLIDMKIASLIQFVILSMLIFNFLNNKNNKTLGE